MCKVMGIIVLFSIGIENIRTHLHLLTMDNLSVEHDYDLANLRLIMLYIYAKGFMNGTLYDVQSILTRQRP